MPKKLEQFIHRNNFYKKLEFGIKIAISARKYSDCPLFSKRRSSRQQNPGSNKTTSQLLPILVHDRIEHLLFQYEGNSCSNWIFEKLKCVGTLKIKRSCVLQ